MATSIKSSPQKGRGVPDLARLLSGKALSALSAVLVIAVLMTSLAARADAVAYTKNVYPPNRIGGTTIEGWADLSLDCQGTLGCWNYIKIERRQSPYDPTLLELHLGLQPGDPALLVQPVDPPVEYVAGGWAKDGWNAISAELSLGCWEYRTHVDSYNRYPGPYGLEVNVRGIGLSFNDTKGNTDHVPWSSDWTTHCLYA